MSCSTKYASRRMHRPTNAASLLERGRFQRTRVSTPLDRRAGEHGERDARVVPQRAGALEREGLEAPELPAKTGAREVDAHRAAGGGGRGAGERRHGVTIVHLLTRSAPPSSPFSPLSPTPPFFALREARFRHHQRLGRRAALVGAELPHRALAGAGRGDPRAGRSADASVDTRDEAPPPLVRADGASVPRQLRGERARRVRRAGAPDDSGRRGCGGRRDVDGRRVAGRTARAGDQLGRRDTGRDDGLLSRFRAALVAQCARCRHHGTSCDTERRARTVRVGVGGVARRANAYGLPAERCAVVPFGANLETAADGARGERGDRRASAHALPTAVGRRGLGAEARRSRRRSGEADRGAGNSGGADRRRMSPAGETASCRSG